MKKFKTKGELKAVEPGGGFKCEICFREFSAERSLTAHEILHMKLTCGLCNKNFKTKIAFDQHEMSHPKVEKMSVGGRVGHMCPVCKKKFKTATQLTYHEMYHTSEELQQVNQKVPSSYPSDSDEEPVTEKPTPTKTKAKIPEKSKTPEEKVKSPAKPKPAEKVKAKPRPKKAEETSKVKEKPADHSTSTQDNKAGKKKVSCEKCKKKFSDAMTLEYHKITFHVSVPEVKPVNSRQVRAPKSKEFVEDSTSNSDEDSLKTPSKRKHESPKISPKKFKRDSSSSEDEKPAKTTPKPAKRVLARKPPALLPRSVSSEDEDEDSEDETLSYRKPPAKQTNKVVQSPPKPKKSAVSVLADELKVRQKFVSSKNEKMPCGQCGRHMANGTVLAYHEIRCTGNPQKIKRKLSQESNRTLSTDTDSRLSVESDRKENKSTKQQPRKLANKFENSYESSSDESKSSRKPRKPAKKFDKSSKPKSEEYSSDERKSATEFRKPAKKMDKSATTKSEESSSEQEEEDEDEEEKSSEEEEEEEVVPNNESVPDQVQTKEKVDSFKSKFSSKGFTEVPTANLYRESLLTTKGVKVKCEFCGKSFKNEQVLNHHNIYCNVPKADKSKSKSNPSNKPKVENLNLERTSSVSDLSLGRSSESANDRSPNLANQSPDSARRPPDFVERSIIKNRSSQSPVDLILKKLSGGVTSHSNSESRGSEDLAGDGVNNNSCDEVANHSVDEVVPSSRSYTDVWTAANPADPGKLLSNKNSSFFPSLGKEKPVSRSLPASNSVWRSLKSDRENTGSEDEAENDYGVKKQAKRSMDSDSEKEAEKQEVADRLADNRVSIYTSSEEENGDLTSDSGNRRPAMHPNARHGVEILEEEMKRKKRAKKEKKAKKAKKKAKKAKKRRSSSESESEEEKKVRKKKKKSRFAVDNSDSDSTNSSHHDVEESEEKYSEPVVKAKPAVKQARKTTSTSAAATNATAATKKKKKKNPHYCLCDKPETMEMIGCDYCDMWYHPECLGLDDEQTQKLTETSWMCPECMEKSESKGARGKIGGSTSRRRSRKNSDSDF